LPKEAWTRRSIESSGKMSHQLIKFTIVEYQPFLTDPLQMLGAILMHHLSQKLKNLQKPSVAKPSTPSMRRSTSTIISTIRRMWPNEAWMKKSTGLPEIMFHQHHGPGVEIHLYLTVLPLETGTNMPSTKRNTIRSTITSTTKKMPIVYHRILPKEEWRIALCTLSAMIRP